MLEQNSQELIARETAKMDARLNKTTGEMMELQVKLHSYATKLENMGVEPCTNFGGLKFLEMFRPD
jgi:hypothetical protein